MGLSAVAKLSLLAAAIFFLATPVCADLLLGVHRGAGSGQAGGGGPPGSTALIHFDGANGSTSFPDSSGNNHNFSANGAVALSTAEAKFGTASLYSNGTATAYASNADATLALGAGDFTIDFWIMWQDQSAQNNFYTWDTTHLVTIYTAGLGNPLNVYSGALGGGLITGTTSVATNTWYHVALTRQGTSVRLFLNGSQQGSTYTSSANFTDTPIRVATDGTQVFKGWIDELRIIKGYAAWTSNFTPPTAPYTK